MFYGIDVGSFIGSGLTYLTRFFIGFYILKYIIVLCIVSVWVCNLNLKQEVIYFVSYLHACLVFTRFNKPVSNAHSSSLHAYLWLYLTESNF